MTDNRRVKGERATIDAEKVKRFFEKRGEAADSHHIYTSVLYQDHNPALAEARDIYEKTHIKPMLALDGRQRVIDVGCGIGRWADAIYQDVAGYLGIDVSQSFVDLARSRRVEGHLSFRTMAAEDVGQLASMRPFDRVLIAGVLIYLNDEQVRAFLNGVRRILSEQCLIYIREPVAMDIRLTLNSFWSNELNSEYSAIYRTSAELQELLSETLGRDGFAIGNLSPLYRDDSQLNNRSETMQHFTILRRELP